MTSLWGLLMARVRGETHARSPEPGWKTASPLPCRRHATAAGVGIAPSARRGSELARQHNTAQPEERAKTTQRRKAADLYTRGHAHVQPRSRDRRASHTGSASPFPGHQPQQPSGQDFSTGVSSWRSLGAHFRHRALSLPPPQQRCSLSPCEHQLT